MAARKKQTQANKAAPKKTPKKATAKKTVAKRPAQEKAEPKARGSGTEITFGSKVSAAKHKRLKKLLLECDTNQMEFLQCVVEEVLDKGERHVKSVLRKYRAQSKTKARKR